MQETKTFDRRTFTLEAALAVLSGVAITISGCGGGSSPTSPGPTPAPTPTPTTGDKTGSISLNHDHRAVITAAQLTAGGALSLNIQGGADHSHTVALNAADIADIAANQRVSRESTEDGSGGIYGNHGHTVTFN